MSTMIISFSIHIILVVIKVAKVSIFIHFLMISI